MASAVLCPLGAADAEREERADEGAGGAGAEEGRAPAIAGGPAQEGGREEAGAPARRPEIEEGLQQQAGERPVRAARRRRPDQPTADEIEEHEACGHEPYRSWCPDCVAGRGRADSHIQRGAGEKALPIFGVDYGFLWNKAPQEDAAAAADEEQEEEPPTGIKTSSPILCGRCSADGWLIAQLCLRKGDDERNRQGLALELLAGGYPRIVVRSDGEHSILAHIRAAVAVAMSGEKPLEVLTETVSKAQSAGNGLAEGAVKEAKAKVRTLRHATERGMGRAIPEDHDALAWLVELAAKTVNWYRPGVDGKTPYERRYGRRFRRPIAPWGQKVWYMPTGKLVSRIGADSRWREGCFLGVLGGGGGANDYAIGTPDGVITARAIKLMPAAEAWDVELLLSVRGLPWDRMKRVAAAPRAFLPGVLPMVPAAAMPPAPRAPEVLPRRVYIREKVEIAKYGMTMGCPGCMAITGGAKPQGHSAECRARIEQRMREDAESGGAERLEEATKRRRVGEGVAGVPAAAAPPAAGQQGGASSSTAVVPHLLQQGERRGLEGGEESIAVRQRPSDPQGERRQLESDSGQDTVARRRLADPQGQTRQREGDADSPSRPPTTRQKVPEKDIDDIMAALLQLGSIDDQTDVAELFCPGRFAEKASAFHLVPGTAFDLRTGWDLATASGRQECWRRLHLEMPVLIVGSPPCDPFSTLQNLNADSARRREKLQQGILFVQFCCSVYEWQHARGMGFLHEHPWAATSWQLKCMQATLALPGVQVVRCDQCAFGQAAWHRGEQGWEWRLARKRSGFVTNVPEIAAELDRPCNGQHAHAALIGGTAKPTERYPPRLVSAILRGLVAYMRRVTGTPVNALEAGVGPHIDEDTPEPDMAACGDDGSKADADTACFYDQYTGLVLPTAGVRAARRDEVDFANKLVAFDPRTRDEAYEKMGRAPFGTRWIDCNKGDDKTPELRSRMVVQETRKTSTIAIDDIAAVTSSTPPLEVVRLFASLMMSLRGKGGEPLVMQFLDVSRAHPHCDALRDSFYIEAPPEFGLAAGMCLLVLKAWYGMRDAGQAFEFAVRDHFVSEGFEQGMFSPCVYKKACDGSWTVYFVHGDDYVGLGTKSDLESYLGALRKRFIIKCRGYLGPGEDCTQIRMLNRILTYLPGNGRDSDCMTYEPDVRHVDLLASAYGLSPDSKGKATPWDKKSFLEKNPLAGVALSPERGRAFRSNCMRALFLAIDRPDMQFCAKEIARAMANPTVNADETLKALARYLVAHPRVVWRFPRQPWPGEVLGQSDANWAACPVTRKSSSACYLSLGAHPVYAGASTQTVQALSSGEAEFYGTVRCACRLLGLRSLLRDVGLDADTTLATDSTACKGLASRRGAGKVRHIQTPTLWLQHAVAQKIIKVIKKPGTELPPDVGTKAGIAAPQMWHLLAAFGVVRATGRSRAALAAAAATGQQ